MTRTRLLSATVSALLLVFPAGSALAQTPAPIERTAEMEARAEELRALFPAEIGGISMIDDLDIAIGQELLAGLDPSDPDELEEIEEILGLMEVAGATLDDAATAATAAAQDETFVFLALFQIRGSDAQETLPTFLEAFQQDIPGAVVEPGQIDDVEVTFLLTGEGADDAAFMFVPRGDITWMASGPMEYLEETVAAIPEA